VTLATPYNDDDLRGIREAHQEAVMRWGSGCTSCGGNWPCITARFLATLDEKDGTDVGGCDRCSGVFPREDLKSGVFAGAEGTLCGKCRS
jgi:hypothetical protein